MKKQCFLLNFVVILKICLWKKLINSVCAVLQHVLLCSHHVLPPPRAFSVALDESSHIHLLPAAPQLKA